MAKRILITCILLVFAICSYMPAAHAATVSFIGINDTNPLGFDVGGTTASGNTLLIDVDDFALAVAGYGVGSMFDTLNFTIVAPAGYYITGVTYYEGLLTTATGLGLTIADGSLSVDGIGSSLGSHLYPSPTTNTFFSMSTGFDLSGQNKTTVPVAITNSLVAVGSIGSSVANIAKGWIGPPEDPSNTGKSYVTVSLTAIPIPPAVWMFGSGMAGLVWFRRKMKN